MTLAFASQGNSLGRWMQVARRSGHEIVMQVPLEPFDYPNVNPGRNTLTVDADAEENIENLHWSLSRITNYTGIMNYMGARFSADPQAMAPLMAELGKRGLLYLDDGSSARSVAPELALKNGVPFAAGDTAIDAVRERGEILKKLDQLEQTARAKGFAVGTGSAFDVTVDAVSSWVNEAKKRGIEIVPISAVATDPERVRDGRQGERQPVDPETLPYRPCVGIMVLNRDGLVWAATGSPKENSEYDGSPQLWQMPQGGIDKGEDPLPAARRELHEETGMRTRHAACRGAGLDQLRSAARSGRHRAQGQISRPDPEMVRLPLRRRRQRDPASIRRPAAMPPSSTAGRGSRWPNCRS